MLSNAGLAIAIENIEGLPNTSDEQGLEDQQTELRRKQSIYFSVILWSVFGLAMVRFLGVCVLIVLTRSIDPYCYFLFSAYTISSTATCSAGVGGTRKLLIPRA